MALIRVGTSGWQYKDWKGTFYPEKLPTSKWLQYYVQHFPTVEVNASFYRLLREDPVRRWREQAPPGFEFVLKGSKFITHNLKLGRPEEPLRRFFEPAQPLLDIVPVILWQLPPKWKRNVERLDEFLSALPAGPRYAVEFRETSWYHEDVFAVLERHNASHCWISTNWFDADFTATGDFVYVRFHGLHEGYLYDYSDEELEPWAQRLLAAHEQGKDAWVFFNNDWHANAIRNANQLLAMLGDAAYPWTTPAE